MSKGCHRRSVVTLRPGWEMIIFAVGKHKYNHYEFGNTTTMNRSRNITPIISAILYTRPHNRDFLVIT